MEENIDITANMVSNLRNMAIDMGSELDSQNKILGRLNDKVRGGGVRGGVGGVWGGGCVGGGVLGGEVRGGGGVRKVRGGGGCVGGGYKE